MKALAAIPAQRRRWLAVAIVVVVMAASWVAVLQPLAAAREALQARATAQTATRDWLLAVSERVDSARTGAAHRAPAAGQSLLGVVDTSLRRAGLDERIERIEPAADGRVRLWLRPLPFKALTAWLQELARDSGVTAANLSANRAEQPGVVTARVELQAPGA